MENVKQAESGKSIFRNVLYGFSTWILPLGLSFVATPLIVKNLGNKDYGIYALVLSFINYSFALNFSRAAIKYVAEFRLTEASGKLSEIISTTFFINILVGLFGTAAICLSSEWVAENVFQVGGEENARVVKALYVSSGVLFFALVSQTFTAILQGVHRFDVYSKIYNFNNISTLLGNIFLVIYGYGLLSLLLWNLATTFITGVLFAAGAKRIFPEFRINLRISRESLKLVLRYSWGIVGYQILGNLLVLFERSWVTKKLGVENLTFYVVAMTIGFCIHSFITSMTQVIFPLASELKDNREKLLRLYAKATKTVCFLVVFLAATLVTLSSEFLHLWMGAEFAEKASALLIIHTVTFSLLAVQTVSWQLTEGLGYPFYNTFIFVICLVINVLFIVWLTQTYGNIGIAAGRLAGFGTMFISVFYVEKWFFKRIQFELWLKISGILGIAAAVSVIIQKIIIANFSLNWASFSLAIITGGIIYCCAVLVLGFVSDEERLLLKTILSR